MNNEVVKRNRLSKWRQKDYEKSKYGIPSGTKPVAWKNDRG